MCIIRFLTGASGVACSTVAFALLDGASGSPTGCVASVCVPEFPDGCEYDYGDNTIKWVQRFLSGLFFAEGGSGKKEMFVACTLVNLFVKNVTCPSCNRGLQCCSIPSDIAMSCQEIGHLCSPDTARIHWLLRQALGQKQWGVSGLCTNVLQLVQSWCAPLSLWGLGSTSNTKSSTHAASRLYLSMASLFLFHYGRTITSVVISSMPCCRTFLTCWWGASGWLLSTMIGFLSLHIMVAPFIQFLGDGHVHWCLAGWTLDED